MPRRVRAAGPEQRGQLLRLPHDSKVLRDNPWGDPHQRDLFIYQPQGIEDSQPLPMLWDLAAYTNAGPGHVAWRNHGETLPQRLDRLIASGQLPPLRMAFPDCYTSLGGNQYLNSPAVGAYEDYLVDELIPYTRERFNCGPMGVFGKSSGGYGALRLALTRPGLFRAVASHAGDVGFDRVYRGDFPLACRVLESHGGDVMKFLETFWGARKPGGQDFQTLLVVGLAASYDPDPGSEWGFRLPFDPLTCELDEAAWQRWCRHDPLTLLEQHPDALRQLSGLYIDVGFRDQYHIQFGSRQLHQRLEALGIEHHYEEFNGTHSGIDHRLDESLPFLGRALTEGSVASKP